MKGKSVPMRLAVYGLLTALVVIATLIFRIPAPTFHLYFNLGEAVIYLTALLYGGVPAAIIGGVGSGMADIIGGYPVWAPITFFIKGLEGLVVGKVAERYNFKKDILAVFCGAVIMITGYTSAAGILYGVGAMPVEFVGDIFQTGAGAIIAIPLAKKLRKLDLGVKK